MARPSLNIGLLLPPWVVDPPPAYGGTEMMVDQLARGLVAAGQSVAFFATGDSTVADSTAHCMA